jgi:hypothetical protein
MHHPWRRTVQIIANAITVLIVLCSMQRVIYPSSGRLADHDPADRLAVRATLLTEPLTPALPFVLYGMVMPTVDAQTSLSIQHASMLPNTVAGGIALIAWIALLLLGLGSALPPPAARMRALLLAALGAQLALQLVVDGETFRSALSSLPLLIALTALGTLSPWRRAAIALSAVLLVSAGINNASRFEQSVNLVRESVAVSVQ